MAGFPSDLLQILPVGPAVFPAYVATGGFLQSGREFAPEKKFVGDQHSSLDAHAEQLCADMSLDARVEQLCADLHHVSHRTNQSTPDVVARTDAAVASHIERMGPEASLIQYAAFGLPAALLTTQSQLTGSTQTSTQLRARVQFLSSRRQTMEIATRRVGFLIGRTKFLQIARILNLLQKC